MHKTLTIATEGSGTSKKRKGRSFSAIEIARIENDRIWKSGTSDNKRPIFFTYAATEYGAKAFTINLRTGRVAMDGQSSGSDVIEFMKSDEYVWPSPQRIPSAIPGGSTSIVQTVYLPELFDLDPGLVDRTSVRFVVMPPLRSIDAEIKKLDDSQRRDLFRMLSADGVILRGESGSGCPLSPHQDADSSSKEIAFSERAALALAVISSHLCARLDRRTRCPLLPDLAYRTLLTMHALKEGLATLPVDGQTTSYQMRSMGGWRGSFRHSSEFKATGLREIGYSTPIAFRASHTDVDQFLAQNVQHYYKLRLR